MADIILGCEYRAMEPSAGSLLTPVGPQTLNASELCFPSPSLAVVGTQSLRLFPSVNY